MRRKSGTSTYDCVNENNTHLCLYNLKEKKCKLYSISLGCEEYVDTDFIYNRYFESEEEFGMRDVSIGFMSSDGYSCALKKNGDGFVKATKCEDIQVPSQCKYTTLMGEDKESEILCELDSKNNCVTSTQTCIGATENCESKKTLNYGFCYDDNGNCDFADMPDDCEEDQFLFSVGRVDESLTAEQKKIELDKHCLANYANNQMECRLNSAGDGCEEKNAASNYCTGQTVTNPEECLTKQTVYPDSYCVYFAGYCKELSSKILLFDLYEFTNKLCQYSKDLEEEVEFTDAYCQALPKRPGAKCVQGDTKFGCKAVLTCENYLSRNCFNIAKNSDENVCITNPDVPAVCKEVPTTTPCDDIINQSNLKEEICALFATNNTKCYVNEEKTACYSKKICEGFPAADASVCLGDDFIFTKENSLCLFKENQCVEVPLSTECKNVLNYGGLTKEICGKFSTGETNCTVNANENGCEIQKEDKKEEAQQKNETEKINEKDEESESDNLGDIDEENETEENDEKDDEKDKEKAAGDFGRKIMLVLLGLLF